eukprot:127223-Pyramimonas_sp.AAC.1
MCGAFMSQASRLSVSHVAAGTFGIGPTDWDSPLMERCPSPLKAARWRAPIPNPGGVVQDQ